MSFTNKVQSHKISSTTNIFFCDTPDTEDYVDMSGKSRHVVLSVHFVVLKMHHGARGLRFTSHNSFMEMFVFHIFKGNTNCHITESQGQKKCCLYEYKVPNLFYIKHTYTTIRSVSHILSPSSATRHFLFIFDTVIFKELPNRSLLPSPGIRQGHNSWPA